MHRHHRTLDQLPGRVSSCLHLHPRAALAVLIALAACADGTGPDGGSTEGKAHPAGVVADRITFNTGHIGIAVAPNGVGYVSGPEGLDRFSTQSPYAKLSSVKTGPGPRDIVFDRTGTTAYAATDNGKVYVLDVAAGTMKATFAVGDTSLSGDARRHKLALAPDGSRAYLVEWGRLWSIPTSGAAPTSVPRSGQAIAVSPTTGAIYISNADDYKVSRVDPSTLLTQATTSNVINATAIAVAPGGDEVYANSPSDILYVFDPVTLAERGQVILQNYGASGITVSPDGTQLYVALFDARVAIVDRATRKVISTLTLAGLPLDVAFDPTGSTAFVVNLEGWVDVIR
jgi:YVTN family beta-propeller protein